MLTSFITRLFSSRSKDISSMEQPDGYKIPLSDYGSALKSGDYSALPWIFYALTDSDASLKTAAADMLCTALLQMTFDDIVRTDRQMRQTTSMEWFIDWKKYALESFFTNEMTESSWLAVMVFASFNPNGFIREQAVRRMKVMKGTLPYLLLRRNDWVLSVQKAAEEAIDYRLAHLSAGELMASLPFADKLSRSERANNADAQRIYTVLTAQDNEKEWVAGLRSADLRIRRICISALFDTENPRYDLALSLLKNEREPFLRADIFQKLQAAGQDLHAVMPTLLTDKFPLNRRLAFQYSIRAYPAESFGCAMTLLLDKNGKIREAARAYVSKRIPAFDYRTFYQTHLADATTPAIWGLGENGTAEDTEKIEIYLKSKRISIVRATMISLMRLNGEAYADTVTLFLADKREGLVKTACHLLIKSPKRNYAKVWEIFHAAHNTNTKQKCFNVLLTASKWQRLEYILLIMEDRNPEMEKAVATGLQRWFTSYNQSYATAAAWQKEKIAASIRRLGVELPSKTRQELLFLLR